MLRKEKTARPTAFNCPEEEKIELDLVKKERVERTEVEKQVLVGYAIVKYSVEDVQKSSAGAQLRPKPTPVMIG